MDSRSTIIDRRHIRINGLFTGMSIGEKKHKITLGYYWLGYDASRRLIDWHKKLTQSINLSYYVKTDVEFISFAYWYPVVKKNKWTVFIPIELGLGRETSHYRQLVNDISVGKKNILFEPYQAGIYSEYRVTPWAGLSAQVGYRNAVTETHFRKHFKGFYYSYGICLYPGRIYRDLKDWRQRRQ